MKAIINLNNEKKGVEIRFDGRPEDTVLATLKAAGFRWSKPQKMWYAKQSEATLETARQIGEFQSEQNPSDSSSEKNIVEEMRLSIFDLINEAVENHSNSGLSAKELAAKIKRDLKARFPMVKFSATSGSYGEVNLYITASPWEKDSEIVKAILAYMKRYGDSYNHCICYDPYADYGSSYAYHIWTNIDWKYTQTEKTVAMANLEEEFAADKARFEAAEEKRQAEEAAERMKQYEIERAEAEKREAENNARRDAIQKRVKVKPASMFMVDLDDCGVSKLSGMSEYAEMKKLERGVTCKVEKLVEMSEEDYAFFSEHLLDDWDFIAKTGGTATDDPRINSDEDYRHMTAAERETIKWYCTDCVAIAVDGEIRMVVDAEGYDYCRYVYVPGDFTVIKQALEQSAEIREEAETASEMADVLDDASADIILKNGWENTWDGEHFKDWGKALLDWLKAHGLKLDVEAIRALKDRDRLKSALYKLYAQLNSIQGKFKAAKLETGERVTLIFIDDWIGGVHLNRVTVDRVEYKPYAQYSDNVRLIFRPERKRNLYEQNIHGDILVYKGWLPDLPDEVLYEITETPTVTVKKSKYMVFDHQQIDDVMNYLRENFGQLPLIDTRNAFHP